jgi:DNA-binding transcriptional MocR family regulator
MHVRAPLDLTKALPPAPPILDQALSATLRRLSDSDSLGQQIRANRPGGSSEDREVAAIWLSSRFGARPPTDRLLVTNGTQSALGLVLKFIAGPGDVVLAEQLTYVVLSHIVQRLGMRIEGVPLDEHGLMPEAFEDLCRHKRPKALYCNPTVHNPTASVMSEARRAEIAAIARRHGVWIIEDDVLGALHGSTPKPIAAIAPDITWYCMSLSKCFSLGMRLAYVVAPTNGAVTQLLESAGNLSSWFPAPLSLMVAADWIRSDMGRTICMAIHDEMVRRQQLAATLLPHSDYQTAEGALHIWLQLPAGFDPSSFQRAALQEGVLIRPSSLFVIGQAVPPNAVRISLSSPASVADLETGLSRLASLLGKVSVAC